MPTALSRQLAASRNRKPLRCCCLALLGLSASLRAGSASAARSTSAAATRANQAPMATTNTQPARLVRPVALLFGDSLTQHSFDPDGGWGAALAHHYTRKLDVVNRGWSGYNSRWGLPLFRETLAQLAGQQVALLVLWFGANDATIPGRSAQRQHVPVAEYSANLSAMVAAAQQAGISNILLLTPPPVGDEARVKHQQAKMGISTPVPPDRTNAHTQQYAAAVVELGKQAGVPVVDLFTSLQDVPGWRSELLSDGLHFTPAGSRRVWQGVRDALEAHMPQLRPEALDNHMPWHDQFGSDFDSYWREWRDDQARCTAAE